ncbi:MAG: hypothetical protein IKJ52_07435 [Muribaculaceae bacterium]|nr:hypothetical protein [Muribaculaceae bacterium]
MKKFFAFLAAGLFLTACSDDVAAPQVGQEQEVTLSFQLPEAIASRAANGGTNSALGGASNCSGEVTFTAALYYNGKEVWRDDATAAIPNANASVTFKPTLVLGENYELVAYAQMDGVITDLTKQVEANAINDETVDAYYVSTTIKAETTMSATLKRATGKLRIIAEDFAAAEKQLGKTIEKVAVTYKQAQPTEFNPTTGNWATEASEVTFSEVVTDYTSEGDAKTLLVDYIPATATGEIINIDKVVVTFSDGTTFEKSLATLDVPVKRNYLTTLTGNFFLGEMDLKIEIDDAFEGEEEINYELAAAFANGGVYTLEEDVNIDETLILAEGKSLVLNLNGKKLTVNNESVELEKGDAIIAYGNLVINGEGGSVTGNTRAVWARGHNSKVTINGGTYVGATKDATEVIYASGNGVIDINAGTFEAKTLDNVSFASPQYAVLNLYGNGKDGCDINVYGGTFVNFDPANNVSENPTAGFHNGNFVAEGYESVKVGDNVFEVCVAPKAVDGVVTLNADASVIKSIVLTGASLQGNNNTIAVSKNVATNYIVNGTGDVTVSNVAIEGNNVYWGEKSTRALYFTKPGSNITIDNVTVKNVGYALNINASVNTEENNLVVKNSSLQGWVSYGDAIDNASFSNVEFSISNYFEAGSVFNGGIRPYCETVFENCKFEKGYTVSFSQGKAMTFKGCTVDGVALTAENFATLLKVEGDATGLLNF